MVLKQNCFEKPNPSLGKAVEMSWLQKKYVWWRTCFYMWYTICVNISTSDASSYDKLLCKTFRNLEVARLLRTPSQTSILWANLSHGCCLQPTARPSPCLYTNHHKKCLRGSHTNSLQNRWVCRWCAGFWRFPASYPGRAGSAGVIWGEK